MAVRLRDMSGVAALAVRGARMAAPSFPAPGVREQSTAPAQPAPQPNVGEGLPDDLALLALVRAEGGSLPPESGTRPAVKTAASLAEGSGGGSQQARNSWAAPLGRDATTKEDPTDDSTVNHGLDLAGQRDPLLVNDLLLRVRRLFHL